MVNKFSGKWVWISGLVFGAVAGVVKEAFLPYPEFNPPGIIVALVAFLLAALSWWLAIQKSGRVSLLRGGIAGALVGLLTPVLVWPVFLLMVALAEARFPEAYFWSPVYMYFSLLHVSGWAMLAGLGLGVVLAFFQGRAEAGQ